MGTLLIIGVITLIAVFLFTCMVILIVLNSDNELDWSTEFDLTPDEDDDNVRLN